MRLLRTCTSKITQTIPKQCLENRSSSSIPFHKMTFWVPLLNHSELWCVWCVYTRIYVTSYSNDLLSYTLMWGAIFQTSFRNPVVQVEKTVANGDRPRRKTQRVRRKMWFWFCSFGCAEKGCGIWKKQGSEQTRYWCSADLGSSKSVRQYCGDWAAGSDRNHRRRCPSVLVGQPVTHVRWLEVGNKQLHFVSPSPLLGVMGTRLPECCQRARSPINLNQCPRTTKKVLKNCGLNQILNQKSPIIFHLFRWFQFDLTFWTPKNHPVLQLGAALPRAASVRAGNAAEERGPFRHGEGSNWMNRLIHYDIQLW